jgi:phage-related protein (TIGR01555 family)
MSTSHKKKKKKKQNRKNQNINKTPHIKQTPVTKQVTPVAATPTRIISKDADPLIPQGKPDGPIESIKHKKAEHGKTNIDLAMNMLKTARIDTTPIIQNLLGGKTESEIKDKSVLNGIRTLRKIGDSSGGYMQAMEAAFKNPMVNKQITDAYINSVTGAGTSIDKNSHNRYITRRFLDVEEMTAMYTNSWVARKIVDIPIDDALSEGINFTHLSAEDDTKFRERLTNLHFFEQMERMGKLGSMSGIGMALIGVRDGTLTKDLNRPMQRIEKNSLTGLTVVDKSYLGPVASNVSNPVNNQNFLSPTNYIVWGSNIHNTRILRFDGDYLPPIKLQENGYWYASVFEKIYDLLGRYDSIESAVSLLPSEMLLKVFKAADMSAWLGGNDNTGENPLQGKIEEVIQVITTLQSVYRTVMLPSDSESSFERQDLSVSGISEILMNYASLVAAAADIPHTRFLGESPAGLSSTGEGQFQDYNKKIVAIQENKYRPAYTYFFNLVAQDVWGDEASEKNLSFTFNSIYSETAEAKVERQSAELTMLRDAVDAGFLQPAQAIAECKARDIFPVITDKYIEWVTMMDKVAEAQESGVWPEYGLFDDSDPGMNYRPPGVGKPEDRDAQEQNESLAEYIQSKVVN